MCQWNPDKVSTLENSLPNLDRNHLRKRAQRQEAVLKVTRNTTPAQIAMHLRREERDLHRLFLEAEDPKVKIDAVDAGLRVRSQLFELIGWPKRPTPAPVKPGRLPAPVDITPDPLPQVVHDLTQTSPESGI